MSFPRRYPGSEAPAHVLELVQRLVPLLIEGEHPALVALRAQWPHARVREVEMTGHGFYAELDVPPGVPLADPPGFAGGDATIWLEGAVQPSGCVLFVRSGRLATLEGYTYDERWPEDAVIRAIEAIFPVFPG